MKLMMVTTIFALEICLLSTVLSLEILPEHDAGELDIFMEDEGYYQISRSKRADNQTVTDQDDSSGESPSEDYTPVEDDASNSTITTETPDTNSKIETSEDPPPDVSGNETTAVPATVINTENLDESQSNNQSGSEQNPTTDEAPITNLIQQPTESINGSPTTIGNFQTTTVNPTTIRATIQSYVPTSGNAQASAAEPTTTQNYVPTLGNVQAGAAEPTTTQNYEIKNDGRSSPDESPIPSSNSSNADIRGISVNIDTPIDTNGDTKQGNETSEFTSIQTPDVPPTVRNETDKISNGTQIQNASKSDNFAPTIVQSNAAAANPQSGTTATTTSKPIAGESDQVNKSSGAGSGILFTIIILVVVAGLAGLGYYMYKKRREGYDPVAVEDREREMTEVKGDSNGFGKPISDDEVKLADQMTPLQPQATPKTFGLRNDESDLESVQVIREDQEDSDRDQRERSVEIEEENRKKDEEKFN